MATVAVASLNTRYGLRPGSNQPYDLVAAVEALDADVVVLEEVWRPDGAPSQAQPVAAALGYRLHEAVTRPGHVELKAPERVQTGEFRIAILSRPPSTARPPIAIGAVPTGIHARQALPVEVDVGGVGLLVVGTHIHRRPLGVLSQMRRLAETLDREPGPVAVLGDMNHWTPLVRRSFPGWRSAVRGRTWPASRPHSQIDHVLVRGEVEVVKGEVLPGVGSDHRPVRALLSIREP